MTSYAFKRLFLLFLLHQCYEVESISSEELCAQNQTTDCSKQIRPTAEVPGVCWIYQTHFCKDHQINSSVTVFNFNDDAPFRVSVQPYRHKPLSHSLITTGINITFDTNNAEITGFYMFLQNRDYQSCRFFDFSKYKQSNLNTKNISLFYDCYVNFDSNYFNFTVRSVPMNQELQYSLKVPFEDYIEPLDICQFQPAIIVNHLSLSKNLVQVKFSPAPKTHHVDHYKVYVQNTEHPSVLKEINVTETEGSNMIEALIQHVPNGFYKLHIVPFTKNTSCETSDTHLLEVVVLGLEEFHNRQLFFAVIIAGACIAVVFVGFLIIKLSKKPPQGPVLPKPLVFLLYSNDCDEHMQVVLKFADYLKSFCNMEVILDEWDQNNQALTYWLIEKIAECQFFVIIISRGIYHKVESKNIPPMEESRPWGDRFSAALPLILDKYTKTSQDSEGNMVHDNCQIVKVFFEYTSRRDIPRCLLKVGTNFELFGQFNNFLCQIHCQQSKSFPIKIYPKMPGSDIMTSAKGKDLNIAVKSMCTFQKQDRRWFHKLLPPIEQKLDEEHEEDGQKMVYLINKDQRKSSTSSSYSTRATTNEKEPESCELLSPDVVVNK